MLVSELLQEAKRPKQTREKQQLRADYSRWKKLVNAPTPTLQKIIDSEMGKNARLTSKELKKTRGVRLARETAITIMKMRSKPLDQWTTEQINWMYRQLNSVSKFKGVDGTLFTRDKNGKKVPTSKLLRLWSWGHIPAGHTPAKYGMEFRP